MIRINLLPEGGSARKQRKKGPAGPGVSPIVIVLLLLLYGGLAGLGFVHMYQPYAASKKRHDEVKSAHDDITSTVKALRNGVEGLAETERMAHNQLEVLTVLDPPDRLYWAEILNMLSEKRPPNVYLREIKLTEKITEMETGQSIKDRADWKQKTNTKRSAEPQKKTRKDITQTLVVSCLSYGVGATDVESKNIALQNALTYQDLLQKSISNLKRVDPNAKVKPPRFQELAKIEFVGQMQEEQIGGRIVWTFQLGMKTEPLLSKEKSNKDAPSKDDGGVAKSD